MVGETASEIFNTFPAGLKIITGVLHHCRRFALTQPGRGRNSDSGVGVIKPIILKLLQEELIPPVSHAREAFGNSGAVVVCPERCEYGIMLIRLADPAPGTAALADQVCPVP
jgi:hypothetical protein